MTDFTSADGDAESCQSSGGSRSTTRETDTSTDERLTTLDARLAALERAVGDGETDLHALADTAAREARLDELDARVREVETRLDELDAAVQAVRGYVGAIRAVNREVERRADAALAAADRLAARDEVTDLDLPDRPASTDEDTPGDDEQTGEDQTARSHPRPGENTEEGDEQPAAESTGTGSTGDDDFAARVRDLL